MVVENTEQKIEKRAKNDQLRRFLSQFVATAVKNMLLFDLGMCVSFPAIVIPTLTGIGNEFNRNENLSLTSSQASWLGSLGYIVVPIGCILSSLITDPLGRKRTMLLVNIPLIIAWFMMHNASSTIEIFISCALLGLGVGLMESPIITYVGEICEPSYRGIMVAYSSMNVTLGALLVFTLNTLMSWRTVGLVCMFVPIFTMIALCFVPETPLWLLSKNRIEEAEKSLCWLRGWVTKDKIIEEFQSLQRYNERSKSCTDCIKQNQKCPHPSPTIVAKMKELKRKQSLKPFAIVMSLFIIAQFSGILSMGPFIVQIYKAYDSPIAPDRTAAFQSFANNMGLILFICLIRFTGKRKIYLTMLTGVFLSSALVSIYGFLILPRGYSSFDKTQNFTLENKELGYIPFFGLISWSFFSYAGIISMPWQMLSEVFPYKVRGTATGLVAGLNYLLSFISTKLYYSLDTSLSMPGVALFNCTFTAIGLILMYNILPETEGRTLEAIELHFSDKTKKFTDNKIPKTKPIQKQTQDKEKDIEIATISASMENGVYKNGCDNEAFTRD